MVFNRFKDQAVLWFGFRFYSSDKGKLTRWFHLKCPFILGMDRVYLLPSLVIMTLQSDIQEIKNYVPVASTPQNHYSVPATPDDWGNIKAALALLTE